MFFPSMVYDCDHNLTILYGARDKQTWGWDGAKWTSRGFGGPPWIKHVMAYDSVRHVAVAFGADQGSTIGETWEYDGHLWIHRTDSGPSARDGAGMAFDPIRGVTVMYGGNTESGIYLAETWEWDGTRWDLRQSNSPPGPRAACAMVFHPGIGQVVLQGGLSSGSVLGDMWVWNGSRWAQLPGFLSRANHALAFDPKDQSLLTFGGFAGNTATLNDELWRYRDGNWKLVTQGGPRARYGHGLAFDLARKELVIMGGLDSPADYLRDTWTWDNHGWTDRTSTVPSPRQEHSMAFDSRRGVVVLFGGAQIDSPSLLNDTWEWNGREWMQRQVSGPPAQGGHRMTFDLQREVTVLFGKSGPSPFDPSQTWEWDGDSWSLRATGIPAVRSGVMTYDETRHRTILFGGLTGQLPTNNLWEWDGSNWNLRSTGGPPARVGGFFAFDSARGKAVLYSGKGVSGDLLHDTWEWDGALGTWSLRDNNGPTYPYGAAMTYDKDHHVTILFTGTHPNPPYSDSQFWIWNGVRWQPNHQPSPLSIDSTVMVYNGSSQRSLVFGGSYYNLIQWELELGRLGDADCDGVVGIPDLMAVINNWGTCDGSCIGDVAPYGGDGIVDITDLLFVINNWG